MATGYSFYLLALPPGHAPVNFLTSPANAQRDAVKAAILNAPEPGPIPVTPRVGRRGRAAAEQVDAASADVGTELVAAGDAAEAGRATSPGSTR